MVSIRATIKIVWALALAFPVGSNIVSWTLLFLNKPLDRADQSLNFMLFINFIFVSMICSIALRLLAQVERLEGQLASGAMEVPPARSP